jgi:hypothetical protein
MTWPEVAPEGLARISVCRAARTVANWDEAVRGPRDVRVCDARLERGGRLAHARAAEIDGCRGSMWTADRHAVRAAERGGADSATAKLRPVPTLAIAAPRPTSRDRDRPHGARKPDLNV